jgi:hypothetical protein
MPIRLKKLIGSFLLVALVVIYAGGIDRGGRPAVVRPWVSCSSC